MFSIIMEAFKDREGYSIEHLYELMIDTYFIKIQTGESYAKIFKTSDIAVTEFYLKRKSKYIEMGDRLIEIVNDPEGKLLWELERILIGNNSIRYVVED